MCPFYGDGLPIHLHILRASFTADSGGCEDAEEVHRRSLVHGHLQSESTSVHAIESALCARFLSSSHESDSGGLNFAVEMICKTKRKWSVSCARRRILPLQTLSM